MLARKLLLPIFLSSGISGLAVTQSRTDSIALLNRDSPPQLFPRSGDINALEWKSGASSIERRAESTSTNTQKRAAEVQRLLDKKADVLFGDSGMGLGLNLIKELGDTPDKMRLAVLTDLNRGLYDALVVAHRRQAGLSTSDNILEAIFESFDEEASKRLNKGEPLPTQLKMWERIANARNEAPKMWKHAVIELREGLKRRPAAV